MCRKRHQAVLIGEKCYVLGGYTVNSQTTDSVEVLDLGNYLFLNDSRRININHNMKLFLLCNYVTQ